HRQTAKSKEPAKETTVEALTFRWSYIILPVAILLLSIILSAYFYHLLPTEVAYHFKLDGTPDKWLSREMTMVWVLTPQFLLTLLAGAIVWGMTKLGTLFRQTGNTWIRPERIISFMGNIIALPQLIVCFAMLNIFSYNSYQRHIMPMWIFVLIIMGLGAITLGIFFILVIRRAWEATQ
ncbi:MAG: DUF1648 domain-containing protein, partial [Dehalococcoidales bacterium]|nr:DUF1648 domain-containing protein [Dehalococcoidales bacterium]